MDTLLVSCGISASFILDEIQGSRDYTRSFCFFLISNFSEDQFGRIDNEMSAFLSIVLLVFPGQAITERMKCGVFSNLLEYLKSGNLPRRLTIFFAPSTWPTSTYIASWLVYFGGRGHRAICLRGSSCTYICNISQSNKLLKDPNVTRRVTRDKL